MKHNDISDLNQCENDILKMQTFLVNKLGVPERNYMTLFGDNATREGIITAFRDHFKDLEDGDIALFQYSGHGCAEYANQAFKSAFLETEYGQNEAIVPYDMKVNDMLPIADKELRLLIHEIQQANGGSKKNIPFVGIFDCCHSGSMLRESASEVKTRRYSTKGRARSLEEYLEGQYTHMEKLAIPEVNYISFTACSPFESAVETPDHGGVFTHFLLKAFQFHADGNSFPSYAQLFSITKSYLSNFQNNEQTPYIEYAGEVSPYDPFLNYGTKALNHLPELTYVKGAWRIGIGAIHGVDIDKVKALAVSIYEKDNLNEELGKVTLAQVEIEHTTLDEEDTETAKLLNGLVESKSYLAELTGRKLAVSIVPTEQAQNVYEAVVKEIDTAMYGKRFMMGEGAPYTIEIQSDVLILKRISFGEEELMYGIRQTDDKAIRHMLEQLSKIAKWEQIHALQMPKNPGIEPNDIEFKLSYYDYDYTQKHFTLEKEIQMIDDQPQEVSLFQTKVGFDQNIGGKPFTFEVYNHSSFSLYFYLIYLDRAFGIQQLFQGFASPVGPEQRIQLFDSNLTQTGFGINTDEDEIIDRFLLIASKKELLVPYVFEQEAMKDKGKIVDALDSHRKIPKGEKDIYRGTVRSFFNQANWIVKRMEVKIVREKN